MNSFESGVVEGMEKMAVVPPGRKAARKKMLRQAVDSMQAVRNRERIFSNPPLTYERYAKSGLPHALFFKTHEIPRAWRRRRYI